mgnify:FL=1
MAQAHIDTDNWYRLGVKMALPKYQKTGIKVRQPSSMDFADAREEARLGRTISSELDRMSEFAFQEGKKLAIQRGEERVRQEGAVPVLTALQQQEGPRTIAEQAAFDAANRIAVVEIETEARSEMRKLVAEADETNMEISLFNDKMSDIQDGYTASLQVVDPIAAGVLNARLQEDNVTYSTKYSEIVTTKAKNAYAEKTTDILTEAAQKVLDLSLTEGATEESIRKAGEDLLQTALLRGTGEKKAQKLVDSTVEAAIRENLFFRFENADILGKQAIIDDLEKIDLYPGMSYEGTINFKDRFRRELNSEINTGKTAFTNELDDAITYYVNTGKVKPGFEIDEDKLTALYLDDQDTLDALLRQWENTQEDAKRYGALSSMPIEKANEVAQQLVDEANSPPEGATGAEVKLLKDRALAFQKALINRQQALREDPALYVTQTNKQAEQLTSTIFKELGQGNINTAAMALSRLNETLNIQYDVMGVPQNDRRLLSKDMAQQMIQSIQAIDDDVEIVILQEIQQGVADLAPRFISELRDNGLAPEYVEAMYIDPNRADLQKTLVELAQTDIGVLKKNITSPEMGTDAVKALKILVEEYKISYLSGGGSQAQIDFDNQFGVAEKLLYKYLSTSNEQPDTIAERVAGEIFKEYKNVVFNSNASFAAPEEFNAQDMEIFSGSLLDPRRLQEMGVQELQVADYPGYISEAVSMAALASNGQWLNNSTGDGIVLHYRTNSGSLLPAKFDNGQLVDIKFKDLQNVAINIIQKAPLSSFDTTEPKVAPTFGAAEELLSEEYKQQAFGEQADDSSLDLDPMKYMRTIDKGASSTNRQAYTQHITERLSNLEEPLSYTEWLKTQ